MPSRLHDSHRVVIDNAQDSYFNRFFRIAQHALGISMARIELVDVTKMASETGKPLSWHQVALHDDMLYISDTFKHEHFTKHPLIIDGLFIRFYAALPLIVSGHEIGRFCVMDIHPKTLQPDDFTVLQDLTLCIQSVFENLQQQEISHQLHNQRNQLYAILNTVVDGILTIDEKGSIQTANQAVQRLFGYTSNELIGKNINLLIPYETVEELTITNEKGHEVTGQRKDGSIFPLYFAVSAMQYDDKQHFVSILSDITRYKIMQQTLEQFKNALDHTIDSVFMCNAEDSRFVYVNESAKKQLGYTEEELLELSVHDINPHYSLERHAQVVEPLLNGSKKSLLFESSVVHKQGQEIPVEITLQAVTNNDQKRIIAILRDISERKAVEQMKNQFVSTVSHELRTPLTSIRGALGLALSDKLGEIPEKAKAMLTMASRNCERLTLLINDLLDLEKIESERMAFNFKPLDLVQLVRQSLEANQSYADKYHVGLTLKNAPEQAFIDGDDNRLLQVLANLLSNAAKFSYEGGQVDVFIERLNGSYKVLVQDYGNGIANNFRARIFGRFAQADSSDARQKGGSGLGLSISKAIIERHQGNIGFDSTEGKGSVFYFTLPVSKTEPVLINHISEPNCLLLCDNQNDTAQCIIHLLEKEGLHCDIAQHSEDAKTMLMNSDYLLILLDLSLQGEDCLKLVHELRSLPRSCELPIIVIASTAKSGELKQQTDALAIVDWLQKPLRPEQLHRALQLAIRGSQRPKTLHVEDDLDIVRIVQTILKDTVDYRFATTLADARMFLNAHDFDLVILDLTLPDGSGLILLNELKGRCPVMIFSGEDVNESFNSQVAAALKKSNTDNEQLLLTIRRVLNYAKVK